ALDLRIVGREVGVGDRPVLAVAVVRSGLEVEGAHAVALPSPGQRAPADGAEANPMERHVLRMAVGILDVVDVPAVVGLRTGALGGLQGAPPRDLGRGDIAGPRVAVLHLVGAHVFAELIGRDLGAGFEDGDLPAGLGQLLGGPPTGGAGAYDD